MFDDLIHSFHCDLTTLSDRCVFMLAGHIWKEKHGKPFNNMTVAQLRQELQVRGPTCSMRMNSLLDTVPQHYLF